ncbi:MAG: hypothetical protein DRQ39_03650 [Gammaproteobacteria bacterium]|nr:MAG: hypothetical protein DRQ39_03650 [Gammaproteobacteria bacterium]RKZ91586.1 MAG: hypothetical protein DRQ40_09720 [Gammaproteobacteria bacterium]RKZ96408.1 MAG: hypothetical protein DRQ46_07125 [Gammaproteobacteria bacterium]RLA02165.1 MAG: hypothetical protein DRQ42_01345 [Gammaproteobacteria bacterium]
MRVILTILFLGIVQAVMAADFESQSLQLCEKVKSCALAELEGQELSPDMKLMIMSSMNGMCDMMTEQYSGAEQYAELHQQAASCMESLSSLSCSELMEGKSRTPACIELEKRAAEYE